MKRSTRRQFMKTSLATVGATVALSGTKATNRVLGANDRINHAVAGIHGRGGAHIDAFTGIDGVQVTRVIDPDSRLFAARIKQIEQKGHNTPEAVQDFRKVLDDKSVDTISIATCNHWHSPMTIFACQAGKDVYVEKPMSHNIHEGRIAVETAHKYDRIVQHGTQSRSSKRWAELAQFAKTSDLGKLIATRGLCYKRRNSIGFKDPKTPPSQLDFGIWLGPAKEQPYHENLVHYNWHWFWDFGNGDIGNQGVHQMDIARWMIPGATWPKSVISVGGRFGYEDQGQTPNTLISIFDYGEGMPQLIFEVRGLNTGDYMSQRVGNMMHFEAGTIAGQGKTYPDGLKLPKVQIDYPSGSQFSNFIDCVRSRKRENLYAEAINGHFSAGLCHLANISYRLGKLAPYDKTHKTLGDDKLAVDAFERMRDHLKDNSVKLEETNYRVGRMLQFDAETEKFVNDDEANRLLTRDYRKPFAIPDQVA